MSEPLKCCPFCGSEPMFDVNDDGGFEVDCGTCHTTWAPWVASGCPQDEATRLWNTRHDAMALDFSPECADAQSSAEDQRARSLYKATRRLIGALPHERLGEHALRAFRDVRRILREVDHPDDGVKAERVQVLQIERGGSGL